MYLDLGVIESMFNVHDPWSVESGSGNITMNHECDHKIGDDADL
jgi:hypothetical protein